MTKEIVRELEEKIHEANSELLSCRDNKITSEQVNFCIIRLQDIILKSSALLSQIKVSIMIDENGVNDFSYEQTCLEQIIDSKLKYYGLRERLRGFKLLKIAILLMLQDEKNMRHIKSKVSDIIAKEQGLKEKTVYGSFKRCIEDAWAKNGRIVKCFKSVPTTKKFVTLIIEQIKQIQIHSNDISGLIFKLRENLENANNYIEKIKGEVHDSCFNWKNVNKFLKDSIQILNQDLPVMDIKVVDNISIEERISIELRLLGMREFFRGYRYAKTTILRVINNEDELVDVRKNLYTNVANKYGVRREDVEKNIRDDISYMWLQKCEITKQFYNIPKMKKFFEYVIEKVEQY